MKDRHPELTTSARQDLRNLYEYVAQFDQVAADRLVEELIQKIHHIAQIGLTGSSRPFLPTRVRAFPYRNWCFYFTVDKGTLTVVRVLQSDQDTTDIVFVSDDDIGI